MKPCSPKPPTPGLRRLIRAVKRRLRDTHPAVESFLDDHDAYVNAFGQGKLTLVTVHDASGFARSAFAPACAKLFDALAVTRRHPDVKSTPCGDLFMDYSKGPFQC